MLKKIITTTAATLALSLSAASFAADIDMNANGNDLAIQGYDPVAYFTNEKPTKGSSDFTATYKNAIYHFSRRIRFLSRRHP